MPKAMLASGKSKAYLFSLCGVGGTSENHKPAPSRSVRVALLGRWIDEYMGCLRDRDIKDVSFVSLHSISHHQLNLTFQSVFMKFVKNLLDS